MTARPLPVIPPKYTGVPITQPEKTKLMLKSFFLGTLKLFLLHKNVFKFFYFKTFIY
jgi:hypothetical protein